MKINEKEVSKTSLLNKMKKSIIHKVHKITTAKE